MPNFVRKRRLFKNMVFYSKMAHFMSTETKIWILSQISETNVFSCSNNIWDILGFSFNFLRFFAIFLWNQFLRNWRSVRDFSESFIPRLTLFRIISNLSVLYDSVDIMTWSWASAHIQCQILPFWYCLQYSTLDHPLTNY